MTIPIAPDQTSVARDDVVWKKGDDVVVTVELLGPVGEPAVWRATRHHQGV